ncbi:UDP-2,3-diacylglucosamine diphosphatase [Campylobacter sputorum]|uniref:UDP-2,3-diacylglucosamine diphosphatase n=1 Tax=Campylobacter sputorum TaxID=206 RepID=UPI001E461373|nr:UDP-2,3-diacylglucosamine diphosphatase [Campylobacter sputorum]
MKVLDFQKSHMDYEIKDGAIFVADVHINSSRKEFIRVLEDIYSGKIKTKQLFLLGDIFDFLSDYADFTQSFYVYEINLINEISKTTQIFFFEGNHDFNLKRIFPNVVVFDIYSQPVKFKDINKNDVLIAHGDKFLPFVSAYLLLILRNKYFLTFLNFIDRKIKFKISKSILKSQNSKNLTYKISDFKSVLMPKIHHYNSNLIIEGHYHQGKELIIENKRYINLSSFACDQRYFIVEYDSNKQLNLRGHNV